MWPADTWHVLDSIEKLHGEKGISHPNMLEVCGNKVLSDPRGCQSLTMQYPFSACPSTVSVRVSPHRDPICSPLLTSSPSGLVLQAALCVVTVNIVQSVFANPVYAPPKEAAEPAAPGGGADAPPDFSADKMQELFWGNSHFDLARYKAENYSSVHVGDVYLTKDVREEYEHLQRPKSRNQSTDEKRKL